MGIIAADVIHLEGVARSGIPFGYGGADTQETHCPLPTAGSLAESQGSQPPGGGVDRRIVRNVMRNVVRNVAQIVMPAIPHCRWPGGGVHLASLIHAETIVEAIGLGHTSVFSRRIGRGQCTTARRNGDPDGESQ